MSSTDAELRVAWFRMPVMDNADATRKRKARAAWAYSGEDQRDLATIAGIKYDRLRKIISLTDPAAPSLDELRQLATAAVLPISFTEDDWPMGTTSHRDLAREVSDLRLSIQNLAGLDLAREVSELRTGVAHLVVVTAQHTQELQALRGEDHRQPPKEDGKR